MLDAIEVRRPLVLAIAIGVSLIALIISTLFPALLTPTLGVGAIIGIAGCLLGAAAAVAVDAGDRTVRGPRHVDAAGANLVTVVRGPVANDDLVTWALDRLSEHDGLRLVLAAAGTDVLRSRRLGESLGAALARRGHRVLYADLCDPHASEPGAVEVVRGDMKLSQVVRFDSGLSLARVGPGKSRDFALTEFPSFVARLPSDVDLLLAALPGLRQPGTLAAVAAADRVLLLVTANETSRVDLIAALDSLDDAHVPGDVILLHDAVQPPAPGSASPDLSGALDAGAAAALAVDDDEHDDAAQDVGDSDEPWVEPPPAQDSAGLTLVTDLDARGDDLGAHGDDVAAADTDVAAPQDIALDSHDPDLADHPTVPFAPLTDLPAPSWATVDEGDDSGADDIDVGRATVGDRWDTGNAGIPAVDDDASWGDDAPDDHDDDDDDDEPPPAANVPIGAAAMGAPSLGADDTSQLAPVGAQAHAQSSDPPTSDAARDPDEWLRIAAALENLANEVWAREDETQGP